MPLLAADASSLGAKKKHTVLVGLTRTAAAATQQPALHQFVINVPVNGAVAAAVEAAGSSSDKSDGSIQSHNLTQSHKAKESRRDDRVTREGGTGGGGEGGKEGEKRGRSVQNCRTT